MLGAAKVLEQPWNVKNAFQGALPLSFGSEPIALDSFKCRIPLSMVNIKDQSIIGRWVMVHEDTGIFENSVARYNTTYREKKGNVNVKWGLETQVSEKGRLKNDYLTFSVPAKLLGKDYFQGITANNVGQVYRELQQMHVASFTYKDFVEKSSCTDIDLKRDFIFEGNFVEAIRELEALVKPSRTRGLGCRTFTDKTNKGIEFASRETTQFKTAPYLKIYAKGTELENHSREFAREYLKGQDLRNIIRMETTIKNKAHIEHLYGHRESSIRILTMMPQEDKQKAFNESVRCHLETPQIKKRGKSTFTPTDWVIYNAMCALLFETNGEYTLDYLLHGIECKVRKSRMRKKIHELYNLYMEGNKSPISPIFSQVFFHNPPIAKSA